MCSLKPPRHISTLPFASVWHPARCFRSTPLNRHRKTGPAGPFRAKTGSDAYSRSRRREPAIALNRYRGNPHLERVVLRWEVSFHYNRRAREN